ncbi:MAG: DUF962 domain-containing protein [Sphingobacteriia bacterium]|nr:DUF962 domain-containing protein [Sphingobacteriia bacterium]
MRAINLLLEEYGESHQNPTNKWIHWICVPIIMFSLIGLLWTVTLVGPLTVGMVFLGSASLYYLRLSGNLFVGMLLVSLLMAWGIMAVEQVAGSSAWKIHFALFAAAWVGQFIGHKIEGRKPSFFKDLQFLLVGPAWLLHFVYRKVGIPI